VLDLEATGETNAAPRSLKVVGIEDLIVGWVVGSLRDGAPLIEAVAQVQACVALTKAGLRGPLCNGYLRRLGDEWGSYIRRAGCG
jgi:hypothetical protein